MAGTGRRVTFHGAFASKAEAVRKERQVGGFIRPTMVRGARRYVVMTKHQGRAGRNDMTPHPGTSANAPASGGSLLWLLLLGGGLWALSSLKRPASSWSPGTVWLDTTDGTMIAGPSSPGPSWRLATQAEIQAAVVPA